MRRFDRMRTGMGDPMNPTIVECFDAPWWRIDRWLWWIFATRSASRGTILIEGRKIRVRAVGLPTRA